MEPGEHTSQWEGIHAAMGRSNILLWIRDAAAKLLKGWGRGLWLGSGKLGTRTGMLMLRLS